MTNIRMNTIDRITQTLELSAQVGVLKLLFIAQIFSIRVAQQIDLN